MVRGLFKPARKEIACIFVHVVEVTQYSITVFHLQLFVHPPDIVVEIT